MEERARFSLVVLHIILLLLHFVINEEILFIDYANYHDRSDAIDISIHGHVCFVYRNIREYRYLRTKDFFA